MLRYDESTRRQSGARSPRNYLARREQTRLLSLVVLLGIVVIAMQQIRGPAAVQTIGLLFGDEAAALPQDRAAVAKPTDAKATQPLDVQKPSGPKSLDPARFADVRDNTFFRNEEQEAWFYTLSVLQQSRPNRTEQSSTYAQLVSQPDTYRGQAVTIAGRARRIEAVTPAANDLGIERLYCVTVQPAGGEVWPITLYCLALPPTVEPAATTNVPMRATGYFFKNESYRWQKGLGITPVLLADTFAAQQTQAKETSATAQPINMTAAVVLAGIISMVLVGVFLLRTATPSRRQTADTAATPTTIDIPEPEA